MMSNALSVIELFIDYLMDKLQRSFATEARRGQIYNRSPVTTKYQIKQ